MNESRESKDFKYSCRICLCERKKMIFLDNPFNENMENGPTILEVLENIMCTQIELNDKYPCVVCEICLQLLNVAYDFKLNFQKSQDILQANPSNMHIKKKKTAKPKDIDEISSNYIFESSEIIDECENEPVETIYINYMDNIEYLDNLEQIEIKNYDDENKYAENDKILDNAKIGVQKLFQKKIRRDELQVKRRKRQKLNDYDKYIIECVDTDPVDEELTQVVSNPRHICPSCPKFYSNKRSFEKHKESCTQLKNMAVAEKSVSAEKNNCFQFSSIEKPVDSEEEEEEEEEVQSHMDTNTFVELNLENLSDIDKELFQSALLLKYQCDKCTKVYSSLERFNKHKPVCRKFKKKKAKSKV